MGVGGEPAQKEKKLFELGKKGNRRSIIRKGPVSRGSKKKTIQGKKGRVQGEENRENELKKKKGIFH